MLRSLPKGAPTAGLAPVYARHASDVFNRRMHKILQDLCRELAGAYRGKLFAVVLGGNYGRGEGGIVPSSAAHGSGVWSIGEAPSEDVDLLIISWLGISNDDPKIKIILSKYESIFQVPIDLAPVITPLRLFFIPRRYNWRMLISNSKVLYGPMQLQSFFSGTYAQGLRRDRALCWSLLLDQGLRMLELLASEQNLRVPRSDGGNMIHQGKFFREIAAALLLSNGKFQYSMDMQLHEFIMLTEEQDLRQFPHIKLLKGLLPAALAGLKNPAETRQKAPENWQFHLNLWLEAYRFIALRTRPCRLPSVVLRLKACRRLIIQTEASGGVIPPAKLRRLNRLLDYLQWTRHHVFFV